MLEGQRMIEQALHDCFNVTFNKWMWGRDTKPLSEKKLNMYTLPSKYRPREQWAFSWIFSSAWHFSVVFHWNEKFQSEKKNPEILFSKSNKATVSFH